jgi:hypothetical protein
MPMRRAVAAAVRASAVALQLEQLGAERPGGRDGADVLGGPPPASPSRSRASAS